MKSERRKRQRRIAVSGALFALVFAVICGRAAYLQVFRGPWLNQQAVHEYEKSLRYRGKRGAIYDASGREMALSIDATSIAAYPGRAASGPDTARALTRALDVDIDDIRRRLDSKRSFVWIKRQASPREADAVRSLKLAGVDFIPEHSRFYPNRTLAAQMLGFTGIDGRGLEGLEFYYDAYLKGGAGKFTVLKDALGRGFDLDRTEVPDYGGRNLVLTLDKTVQFIAEEALREGVVKSGASSGMAIVMSPATGQVLALAHYPFFNPNAFARFDRNLWRNRAVTDPFEPGSTTKIFTAAAAIEHGGCRRDTIFFCEDGAYQVGDYRIHDTSPHGWLTLENIIKYSSNIGAVKVGEMIGPQILYRTLRDFGFGDKTGIDCPGEAPGRLPPFRRWSKAHTGTISYGHGMSSTAIQLITAVCAIANDGALMKPYIVQAVTDRQGRPIERFGPRKVRQAISGATASVIRGMMRGVVTEGGTGARAALNGYAVCGKTGTAQKIDETGAYADKKYIASFVGFAPAARPAAAILVIIDEPTSEYYGGLVAAPVFQRIAREALNYLNVAPKYGPNQLTALKKGEESG
jgi:cell division protein FtsI (penicillin-binding protein 3)